MVSLYFEMPDNEETSNISPWLLRIVLKKEMMLDKQLNMSKVASQINSQFEDELNCIFSDDNAETLVTLLSMFYYNCNY